MTSQINNKPTSCEVERRSDQLERELHDGNYRKINRLFVWLMVLQWIGGTLTALFVSPYSWIGDEKLVHVHVWAAIVLGGIISSAPILLGIFYPERTITRHVIAVSQALWGAFLIHLSGGRIEVHFHIFCSLAFIAFYRDWKTLLTMTIVVALDHAVRGILFPLSVYGIVLVNPFRWLEHTAWVLAEVSVLTLACRRGRREARAICFNQAKLEQANRETERRVDERTRELKEKTEELQHFALVLKHTDNSVLVLDSEGKIESTNEGFTRITGYGLSEVVGKKTIDLLSGPTTKQRERQQLSLAMDSQKPFDLVIHTHRKNGEPMVLSIETRPIFDNEGSLIRYVQIERDITQSVKEKERLQTLTNDLQTSSRQLEKLSLVAKYTDNSVVITDAGGKIQWVNEAFNRVTGYTLDEVLGHVGSRFLNGPQTSLEVTELISTAVQRNEGFNVEILNYRKNGTPFWSEIEARPIFDEAGHVTNIVAIQKDVTQRKDAEKERERLASELQDAARQAGMAELAGDVLHNVGNALNSLNVSAQTLRQRIESNSLDMLSRATSLISEQGEQLAAFVSTDRRGREFPNFLRQISSTLIKERTSQRDELMSLNEKIEHIKEIVAGQAAFSHRRIPCEPIVPSELITNAINMNDASLRRHGVKIIRADDHISGVLIEKHSVLQVLVNLIKNAKESVVESGTTAPTIKLSTEIDGDEIKFIITDNGIGISRENLTKIFQYGFSTKVTSHGFGLHSSGNIAQELGGSLTVESDGVGHGAKFTLRLPHREAAACLI